MVVAIPNTAAYTGLDTATALGSDSLLNASNLSASQQALLEAQLVIYTQQLAEAQTANSGVPGAPSILQIQQQITSLQQQLEQLNTFASALSTQSPAVTGNQVDTFA